jgi:hypothetical protein
VDSMSSLPLLPKKKIGYALRSAENDFQRKLRS